MSEENKEAVQSAWDKMVALKDKALRTVQSKALAIPDRMKQEAEQRRKIKKQADECALFYKDLRYPEQQAFLSELRKRMQDYLAIEVRAGETQKAVGYAFCLEFMDNLLNRPERIIKMWDDITKKLRKENGNAE